MNTPTWPPRHGVIVQFKQAKDGTWYYLAVQNGHRVAFENGIPNEATARAYADDCLRRLGYTPVEALEGALVAEPVGI